MWVAAKICFFINSQLDLFIVRVRLKSIRLESVCRTVHTSHQTPSIYAPNRLHKLTRLHPVHQWGSAMKAVNFTVCVNENCSMCRRNSIRPGSHYSPAVQGAPVDHFPARSHSEQRLLCDAYVILPRLGMLWPVIVHKRAHTLYAVLYHFSKTLESELWL